MSNILLSLHCPDCGKKITEDDSECPHCGISLDAPLGPIESLAIAQEYLEKAQKSYDNGRNLKGALADIELALEFEPESAEAHNLRGLILDAIERPDEAINSYRDAIRLNPYLQDARANLEDAETERRNKQQVLTIDPSNPKTDLWPKIIVGLAIIVVAIGVFAGLGSVYALGRDYFSPKNTIIFESDYSKVSAIDTSALEKTAEILTERSRNLGYSNVSFVVADNNQIVGKIPSRIDAKALIEKISPVGLLEFVDFGNTPPAQGDIIQTDLENTNFKQTDEKQWHTIMTNNSIKEASVLQDQMRGYQISISLTDSGAKILADHTATNVGTYLGIVLDKIVISVPKIQEPITGGRASISGSFTLESANNLAILMQTTPLPIPLKLVQGADSAK